MFVGALDLSTARVIKVKKVKTEQTDRLISSHGRSKSILKTVVVSHHNYALIISVARANGHIAS